MGKNVGSSLLVAPPPSSESKGEPTGSIDGNYHRNKTITFWSNGITCLYRKYMVFPLKDTFTIENGLSSV